MSNKFVEDLDTIEEFREPRKHPASDIPSIRRREIPAPNRSDWRQLSRAFGPSIVGAGQLMGLDEFLTRTSTTSFLVVADDVIVHEAYADGVDPTDRLLGNSATKSVLALVTGLAVDRGDIADLDDRVCSLVPELEGSGYRDVTIRQVLTMTSAVDWLEDYHDPDSRASRIVARWRDGLGGTREAVATIGSGATPGSRYAYCSPDSIVLDWVRERATGQRYDEAVAELWNLIEAEEPAVIGFDAPPDRGGVAIAAGSLFACARDWARVGNLQIDGRWRRRRVVSTEWIDASSRPEQPFLRPGRLPSRLTTHAGFGYHWWPLDDDGDHVMADGMRGQFVYVDRRRRIVIVKTSAWPFADPWWDRQCRDLCYLALPAIADAVAAVGNLG